MCGNADLRKAVIELRHIAQQFQCGRILARGFRRIAAGHEDTDNPHVIEAIAEMFLAGIIDPDGRINSAGAAKSPRIVADGRTHAYTLHAGQPDIRILQNDVRAIQLAKAALYAGARLLMERFGVEKVDRIRLAGAFGAQIDVKYAMVLGLIPECDLRQVSSAGNAAGTGARIALLDRQSRDLVESQVRQVEKIETAVAEKFEEYFVAAMAFPNRDGSTVRSKKKRRRRRCNGDIGE